MLRLIWISLLRSFRRRPVYTLISVGGLAVSFCAFALILLFIRNANEVNDVFPDADRIYRIDSRWRDPSMGLPMTTMAPVGATLVESYPEFETQTRIYLMSNTVLVGADSYREDVMMVDSTFFDVFGIPFVRGDPETSLNEPRSVVLTDSAAIRFFGTTDALGRTLRLETWRSGLQPFTVTGVRTTLPFNSVTDYLADNGGFDIIVSPLPYGDYFNESGWTSWDSRYLVEFVKLTASASPDRALARLDGFIERHAPESLHGSVTVWFNPLSVVHLTDFGGRRARAVRLLFWIAVVLLVIGAITFTNMSTARSMARARESGIRQAVGAAPLDLTRHFLMESLLLSILAAIVGAGIAWILQDLPFALSGSERVAEDLFSGDTILKLAAVTLAAGLSGGLYPALVFASFPASRALSEDYRPTGLVGFLRQSLVVLQYSAALVLLIAAATMWRQFRFIGAADLGFERDRVLVIDSVPRQFDAEGVARMHVVAERFKQIPGVESTSLSWRPASEGGDTRAMQGPGMAPEDAASIPVGMVDADFAETFSLRLIKGRFFDEAHSSGTGEIVLNRSATKALGLDADPVGQSVIVWYGPRPGPDAATSASYTVIGVLEDYHFGSLKQELGPLALISLVSEPMYRVLSLRMSSRPTGEQIARIESAWHDILPEAPFVYSYLEDLIDDQYDADRQAFRVVSSAALLAILMACLGMLGLASIMFVRRTREAGIRKALGASSGRLFTQFSVEYSRPVLLAIFLAVPVAYVLMSRWLGEFAYAVDVGATVFVAGSGATLALTLLTVGYHTLRTARTNPASVLRNE